MSYIPSNNTSLDSLPLSYSSASLSLTEKSIYHLITRPQLFKEWISCYPADKVYSGWSKINLLDSDLSTG